MLIELVWKKKQPEGIILGFAINVNNKLTQSDDLYNTATSLSTITNNNIDIKSLLETLIQSLDLCYQKWLCNKFEKIYETWKNNQIYIGKQITIHHKNGNIETGIAIEVLSNGDLIFKNRSGEKSTISFYTVETVEKTRS